MSTGQPTPPKTPTGMSVSLCHGPTGQNRAGELASNWGRLVGVYGHPVDGLSIDIMREVAEAMLLSPVGDRPGSLVIGPVDVVSQGGIEDVLLKSLEEYNSLSVAVRPYLWAHDIGGVRPTIRSRCLDVWCPGQTSSSKYLAQAGELLEAVGTRNVMGLLDVIGKPDEWKQNGDEILRSVSDLICSRGFSVTQLQAWLKIRPLLVNQSTGIPVHEAVAELL